MANSSSGTTANKKNRPHRRPLPTFATMFPYLRISKIRFITRFALNYHARDYVRMMWRMRQCSRMSPPAARRASARVRPMAARSLMWADSGALLVFCQCRFVIGQSGPRDMFAGQAQGPVLGGLVGQAGGGFGGAGNVQDTVPVDVLPKGDARGEPFPGGHAVSVKVVQSVVNVPVAIGGHVGNHAAAEGNEARQVAPVDAQRTERIERDSRRAPWSRMASSRARLWLS